VLLLNDRYRYPGTYNGCPLATESAQCKPLEVITVTVPTVIEGGHRHLTSTTSSTSGKDSNKIIVMAGSPI
jgi:hypothetical protein